MPIIWCANQEVTALEYNPIYHAKTKHIELDIHFIRDKVVAKQIQVCFILSADQTTNLLTKAHTFKRLHYLRSKLNVHSRHFNLREVASESDVT